MLQKKYILFPKLHLKHLLFLFFLIVSCIKKGVQIFFEQNQRIAIEFLKLYMYNIGDMFTIIPYLIMKKRMKNENIKSELKKITFIIDNAVSSLDYLYYNPENIRNKIINGFYLETFFSLLYLILLHNFLQ